MAVKKRLLSIIMTLTMVVTMVPLLSGMSYAAEDPYAPANLSWDGTTAKWTIPNIDQVHWVYFDLYNTKDEDESPECITHISGSSTFVSDDVSKYLIPGDTYYFTVFFEYYSGDESTVVRSPYKTVEGSYVMPTIENLTFNKNGKITWTPANYATIYKTKLYVKNGEYWNELQGPLECKTEHSWASQLEAGKTYKADLTGYQGAVQVTQTTETNEFTRNALTKLATPTGLTMVAGIVEWNTVENAKNQYQLSVYEEGKLSAVYYSSGDFEAKSGSIITENVSSVLEKGHRYNFIVLALGDDADYSNSDEAVSEVFEYKGGWTNVRWDGQTAKWDAFYDATDYWVYIQKDGFNPYSNGFESDSKGTSYYVGERMHDKGTGTYTFSVVPEINGRWRDDLSSEISTGYEYTLHGSGTVTEHAAVAATCTTDGNSAYWYCPHCKKYFSDAACTKEIEENDWIIEKHHSWDDNYTVDTPATCTGKGYESIHCSKCTDTKNARDIAATGHHYDTKVSVGNGCYYKKCKCGAKAYYTSPSYVSSFKLSGNKKSFTAKWKKQSSKTQKKFSGYRIRYSRYSNMSGAKTIYVSKKSSSKTIKKLSAKKRYYVEIRSYVSKGGKKYYSKAYKKSIVTK